VVLRCFNCQTQEGDARRVRTIEVMGEHYIVVAVNNGGLQFFKLLRQAAISQAETK